jgi:hypothetical protein
MQLLVLTLSCFVVEIRYSKYFYNTLTSGRFFDEVKLHAEGL